MVPYCTFASIQQFRGAGRHRTGARRIALVFRFVAPAVAQRVGATDYGMVVRGANRTSNLWATPAPMDDFAPAAIRLHDEITESQADALAAGSDEPLSYRRG